MIWFWLGFFAFVAVLLVLDLGVLNRKPHAPTLKSAAYWTAGWMALGFAFTGFVYLMYDNHWLGAKLIEPTPREGRDASIMYVSAYLLEYALSVDNIFVISLVFTRFRVKSKYQHRVLFWGILGAIVFRLIMLGGGAWVAHRFTWIFYIFGAYLGWQGVKMLFSKEDDDDDAPDKSAAVRILRRFVRIVDTDDGGRFMARVDGKRALTTLAVCLISVELTDIVFALDSIPAVLSVSQDTFVMVTSNIFAIMGLRSLYFVLVGAMDKFKYLKIALAILLIVIGLKMVLHSWVHVPHVLSLAIIAGIIGAGVIASIVSNKREEKLSASMELERQKISEAADDGESR